MATGEMANWSNTRLIGKVIYTDYIFAFEIAGLVLLVAIIAAIGLTERKGRTASASACRIRSRCAATIACAS